METAIFYILAASAIFSAILAITRRSPLMSALMLALALLSVSGIFALLAAPLVAALQILISAGAVMVLFIFVIMLVDLGEESSRRRVVSFARILGAAAAGYLALILALAIWKPPFLEAPAGGPSYEAPLTLAQYLTGRYAMPFELSGVMLLAAAIAAVMLSKSEGRAPEAVDRDPALTIDPPATQGPGAVGGGADSKISIGRVEAVDFDSRSEGADTI